MYQLLPNHHQRQSKLVNLLFRKNKFTHFNEIAMELGCSRRIIYQDIEELKNTGLMEINSNKSGLQIIFPLNFGLDTMHNYFFNQSVSFKLLNLLFFEDFENKTDLCNMLYISHTTLIKTITKINNLIFNEYKININPKNLQFEGDEETIRLFLLKVFYENRSPNTWPFTSNISPNSFHEFISTFISKYLIKSKIINYQFFSCYLMINSIRYKNNHLLNIKFSTKKAFQQLEQKNIISDFNEFFKKNFNLTFNNEAFSQIFYKYSSDDYINDVKNITEEKCLTPYAKQSCFFLKKELSKLSYELGVYLPNLLEMIQDIHNSTLCFPFNTTAKTDRNVYPFITEDSPLFEIRLNKIQTFIVSYLSYLAIPYNRVLERHLIYRVLSSWDKFFHQMLSKKITIGYISNFDANHCQMVVDYLKLFFNPFQIDFVTLNKCSLDERDVDIIISNSSYPNYLLQKHQVAICLENFPTTTDIENIFKQVIQITCLKNRMNSNNSTKFQDIV